MHTAYVSVRLGLLALLDQADMYGYQLKSQFEAHTGAMWPLNIGQVYSTLERLERDGLVAVAPGPAGTSSSPAAEQGGETGGSGETARPGGREQKYYAITRAGRDVLADWFATSPADAPPPRDELVTKVLFALAGGRKQALAVITRQRTALTAALQAQRRGRRSTGDARPAGSATPARSVGASAGDQAAALAADLVEDAFIARAEADLRWLDLCEARVAHVDRNGGSPT